MQDLATKFDIKKLERLIDTKADKTTVDRILATMATKQDMTLLEAEIAAIKTDVNRIINMLDHDAKKRDDYEVEQHAIKHLLSRHDRWHREVADKIGHKLSAD